MKRLFVLAVVLPLAVACSKSAESKGAPSSPAPGMNGSGPAAPAPAGPTAAGGDQNDSSFNLQIASPEPGKAGAEVVAHVTVTPGAGYHVNQDFPTKLVVTPPDGVKVAKAEQHKEDAAELTTTKLQFDVKLTADKAGSYKVPATFKFAVCTESSCDPKKREIAFDLAAN